MKREQKRERIADLQQKMSRAKVAILTRFSGLNVEKMTQLRREMGKAAAEFQVIKNTLFRLAVRGTDKEGLAAQIEGPLGVAWSDTDPVAPARVLAKYAKEWPELKILLAASDGKIWGPADIQAWISLPSLEGLRAKILGLIHGPATSLVRLMGTPAMRVARALHERGQQSGTA